MIDVSQIPLSAAVVLLAIERSNKISIEQLYDAVPINKRTVDNIISKYRNHIVRELRYANETKFTVISLHSEKITSQGEISSHSENSPLKTSHVNVNEHNLTKLTNREIFVEEESATSLPKNTGKQEPVCGTSRGIHTAAGTCPAPFPANSAYSAPNGTAGIITAAPLPQFPKSIAERFLLRQKLEFTAGTIFVSENRPTEYLHRMLAELGIDYVPNSDKPLIATDAYSLFLDGLPKFYRQFHKKPVRYGVDDFILHCLSFLRAKGYPQLNSSESVREFFNGIEREQMLAKNESRNAVPNSKTLALQLIGQMFIEEVYGWNPKLPFIWKQQNKADFSAAVWQAERRLAAANGFEPRRQLFYSMFAGIESVNPPLAVPAPAKPAETVLTQPPKAEPLKYSEVLEQIEAKEKQAEPQKRSR